MFSVRALLPTPPWQRELAARGGDARAELLLKQHLLKQHHEASTPDIGDTHVLGGEPTLVYLSRESLEACALCFLRRAQLASTHVNVIGSDGLSPLHIASARGQHRLVRRLLSARADPLLRSYDALGVSESLDARDQSGSAICAPGQRVALHFAAASGQIACVRMLLHVCPRGALSIDCMGASASILAAAHGHPRVASLIDAAAHHAMAGGAALLQTPLPLEFAARLPQMERSIVEKRRMAALNISRRPLLHTPFLLPSLLTADACAAIVCAAEDAARRHGGWHTGRHRYHSTVDIPACDLAPLATYSSLRGLLERAVLPAMHARYRTGPLKLKEAFVVRYEAPAPTVQPLAEAPARATPGATEGVAAPVQAGLGMHRDGTLLNCVILLSEPGRDFSGGGTVFAPPLDRTYTTQQGDCLCSSGQLRHGAAPVTNGVRYVLVAFIDELFVEPSDPQAAHSSLFEPSSSSTSLAAGRARLEAILREDLKNTCAEDDDAGVEASGDELEK
jgi:hypothetical protein